MYLSELPSTLSELPSKIKLAGREPLVGTFKKVPMGVGTSFNLVGTSFKIKSAGRGPLVGTYEKVPMRVGTSFNLEGTSYPYRKCRIKCSSLCKVSRRDN